MGEARASLRFLLGPRVGLGVMLAFLQPEEQSSSRTLQQPPTARQPTANRQVHDVIMKAIEVLDTKLGDILDAHEPFDDEHQKHRAAAGFEPMTIGSLGAQYGGGMGGGGGGGYMAAGGGGGGGYQQFGGGADMDMSR